MYLSEFYLILYNFVHIKIGRETDLLEENSTNSIWFKHLNDNKINKNRKKEPISKDNKEFYEYRLFVIKALF